MKKWLLVAIIACLTIAFFYVSSNEHGANENKAINATLIINFGDYEWNFSISLSQNTTVYGLLEKASKIYNFSYEATYYPQFRSYYIESINGVRNGVDGKYWQYWINGKYGETGASLQPIKNGDVVEWKWI